MEMRIEVLITDGARAGKTGKQKHRARVDLPESGPKLMARRREPAFAKHRSGAWRLCFW